MAGYAKKYPERATTPKVNIPTWTYNDEAKFIRNLGTHRPGGSLDSKAILLNRYIEVHMDSPHEHHQKGVNLARILLSLP